MIALGERITIIDYNYYWIIALSKRFSFPLNMQVLANGKLSKNDHIIWLITLSVISFSSVNCNYETESYIGPIGAVAAVFQDCKLTGTWFFDQARGTSFWNRTKKFKIVTQNNFLKTKLALLNTIAMMITYFIKSHFVQIS